MIGRNEVRDASECVHGHGHEYLIMYSKHEAREEQVWAAL